MLCIVRGDCFTFRFLVLDFGCVEMTGHVRPHLGEHVYLDARSNGDHPIHGQELRCYLGL